MSPLPDERGHFGPYGGRFVPETLVPALDELTAAWKAARRDPAFQAELEGLLRRALGAVRDPASGRTLLAAPGVARKAAARTARPRSVSS